MGRSDNFFKKYGNVLDVVKQREKEEAEDRKHEEELYANYIARRKEEKPKVTETSIVGSDERLREYQRETVKRILDLWKSDFYGRHATNIMLQMPTGTGKTRLFVALINALNATEAKNYDVRGVPRFLIVTHREELVEQISDTLASHYNLSHTILGKGTRIADDNNVTRISLINTDLSSSNANDFISTSNYTNSTNYIYVSSIQYLSRRLKDNSQLFNSKSAKPTTQHSTFNIQKSSFDFIIIDEAHHSLAESYKLLWRRYPSAYKLGVTATPYRLRGNSFTNLFERLITSQKISVFIEQGYLADYRFFTVSSEQAALQKVNRLTKFNIGGDYQIKDLQEIYANSEEIQFLYKCYEEHAKGKRGIIYAVNQLHAEMIAAYFAEHGVSVANIDSKTASARRKELIAQFRSGKLQVLVNVELFGEGFDCPAIEFAMLARPTRSLAMYLQQVGRTLRPFGAVRSEECGVRSDKVVILDCVGLYNRFGLPERERNWDAHFAGNKIKGEDYTRALGLDEDTEGMIEISTPRVLEAKRADEEKKRQSLTVYKGSNGLYGIRNGLGEIHVSANDKELTQAKGGWFYGKDLDQNLNVFNKKGVLVFKRKHCDVKLTAKGLFYIRMRATDGAVYKVGPYKDNMYIDGRNLDKQEIITGSEKTHEIMLNI